MDSKTGPAIQPKGLAPTTSSTAAPVSSAPTATAGAPSPGQPLNGPSATGTSSTTTGASATNPSAVGAPPRAYAKSSALLNDTKLNDILLSDAGPNALLARLKQSILSAKEYAAFVKKAAISESEHLSSLKKNARATRDAIKRPDLRQGTFGTQFNEIVRINERLCDVGNSYVAALHIMHDELSELAKNVEKSRKSIKETCVRNEKNVVDAEQAVEKAQSKYNSLCEEYEKMRVGDPTKNKFGFKQSRTPQHEEDLHKKVTLAEADFQQRVETNQRMRRDLLTKLRPSSVKQLKDLILEIDSAISYQLQKYANLNENLALNRGFIVSPMKTQGGASSPALSMKELATKVDNELDFYNFVIAIPKSARLNRPQINFQQHHTLATAYPSKQPSFSTNASAATGAAAGAVSAATGSTLAPSTTASSTAPPSLPPIPTNNSAPNSYQPVSAAASPNPNASAALPALTALPATDAYGRRSVSGMTASTVNSTDLAPAVTNNSVVSPEVPSTAAFPPGTKNSLPVYGTPLDELLDYEEGTVPRVVYQCIQAVDSFGLEVEGIYRASGNTAQVQQIKRLFDQDSTSVDLLRPNENLNDIHSVAAALKLYFRELPDPLLTKEFHREFLAAAQIDNDVQRRDAIHATINKLPDPNYTTMRYLIFHLYRVQEREAINRMSIVNLGIVWGPTLMATDYSNVGEMALQGKIIETVLLNAYIIFDAE